MAESGSPVRFGILGCANIARKLLRAMVMAKHATPFAIGSRSLDKAERFVAEAGLAGQVLPLGSYEAVLEHSAVDAVYIPLPTALHREWVLRAAAHKKHILLEKPLALRFEELEEMLAACDSAGVQVMDGTMWLHNPRAAALKTLLADEAQFGRLLRVSAAFFFKGSAEFLATNIRVRRGLDELGCLGDVGWYCIGAALFACDYQLPSSVAALPHARRNAEGVPLRCGATLWWADGRSASFECGFDSPLDERLKLSGTEGTILIDDFVIPHREDRSDLRVETGARLVNGLGIEVQVREVSLPLPLPQEVLMLECLAGIVGRVKAEGRAALDPQWPQRMRATQRVLSAVWESLEGGGREVLLGGQ